jgi:hypothetical protein
MAKNSSKDRGIFLTVLIAYAALSALLVLFFGMPSGGTEFFISILQLILLVASIYGIWIWKKWGVYSVFAYILISFISIFALEQGSNSYGQGGIVLSILVAALWFWAIRRKWSYFK